MSLVFENDSLDVEGFLGDLAVHLRRKDLRPMLSYLGVPHAKIDDLIQASVLPQTGTDRGLLTSSGVVIDNSSTINFLEQRKKAVCAWWQFSAQAEYRPNAAQQNVKVLDARPQLNLPRIKEESENLFISRLPTRDKASRLINEEDTDTGTQSTMGNNKLEHPSPIVVTSIKETLDHEKVIKTEVLPRVSNGAIVQIPTVDMSDAESQTNETSLPYVMYASNSPRNPIKEDQDLSSTKVTIDGTGVTLEENLKKLWRCLQSCGLKRVVDEMQERWMIRLNTREGKADMFPKMTWGTPPPPQTPFTYPPYKKIGHMAVMGCPVSLEKKIGMAEAGNDYGNIMDVTRETIPPLRSSRSRHRMSDSSSISSSLDTNTSSFPAREAWKMRTDNVKRLGGTIAVHLMVDNVTFPAYLTTTWGSSLNVTSYQMRERAARVFLGYVMREGRDLSKCIDRIERIKGLVVERVSKRLSSETSNLFTYEGSIGSEITVVCRCLYPEAVEQLWLWYQSGQLRESVQTSLVTKRACGTCNVEQLRIRVQVAEDEYRRALGLLRRKPMPNTKTGRYHVTPTSGGVIGGKSGLFRTQRQAMLSVTKYLKLPIPSPHKQLTHQPFSTPLPIPLGASYHESHDSSLQHKAMMAGRRINPSKGLIEKILNKEVLSIRQRVRMCEDEWCEFASHDLNVMLNCSRQVMQRRIQGAISKDQLTPTCHSLSLLRALHHSIISRIGTTSTVTTPRIGNNVSNVGLGNTNIALHPAEIVFSHADLLSACEDDDAVIKARKQQERDFASAFAQFSDLVGELGQCRNNIQERIINRLTTNPTIAHSKQLYLTKDIYLLMERWRNLVKKDFNFSSDSQVRELSNQILSDEVVSSSFHEDLKLQFPGIIGLLPAIFQVADQVLEKIQHLLSAPYGSSMLSSYAYSNLSTTDGVQKQVIPIQLNA